MGPERLLVGRIAKAHGIRGEVAVDVVSDAPDRFVVGARFTARGRDLTIETVRPHHQRLLIKFEEVFDRNEAEELRGARLEIDASEAADLEDGSYYPHEIVGFDVVGPDGTRLGTLARVQERPEQDLWVVDTGDGEAFVPAVREIVTDVDTDARVITVDPPEGLF